MNELRFVVDLNAGRLATWLRVMGYDTLFLRDADEGELVGIALREGRIIFIRDTGITQRRLVTSGCLTDVLVEEDDLKGQLVGCLGLDSQRAFVRCVRCNESLDSLSTESAKNRVPPYVYQTQEEFMQCPRCLCVDWRGTHWENMHRELAEVRDGEA